MNLRDKMDKKHDIMRIKAELDHWKTNLTISLVTLLTLMAIFWGLFGKYPLLTGLLLLIELGVLILVIWSLKKYNNLHLELIKGYEKNFSYKKQRKKTKR